MKTFQSFPVMELRPKVAHGETVGFNSKMNKAPAGAKAKIRELIFCRPSRGLKISETIQPTVSPWATFWRASGAFVLATMILFFAADATAETTNVLSDVEIQGRQLAAKILAQWPSENSTNYGTFQIRDSKGNRTNFPVEFQIIVSPTNWVAIYYSYTVLDTNHWNEFLQISHDRNYTNDCLHMLHDSSFLGDNMMTTTETSPFANSDFWLGDLGLEFFHWPQQKILKKEFHNNTPSIVLESRNPQPVTNGYARVVSRIEEEGGGVMEAQTYDVANRPLKDFRVKNLKKVDGRWQVELVIMKNLQTGSTTRLEFDLKK